MNYDLFTLLSYDFNGICTASNSQLHVNYDNSFTPLHKMELSFYVYYFIKILRASFVLNYHAGPTIFTLKPNQIAWKIIYDGLGYKENWKSCKRRK